MRSDILVVGQGLAGTLLAWELERVGIEFSLADQGHAAAATSAAAGMINPITGQRLVKSWRVDSLLPAARQTYRELETALGVRVWHEMRVRRVFADERERRVLAEKRARGELAPFAGAGDTEGFWIEGAARVDVQALLRAARQRWRPREVTLDLPEALARHECVIDCRGLAAVRDGTFDFVPWEFSQGEMIEIAVEGLAPDVVLNRGHWVLPVAEGRAWAGATHEPGKCDATPTAEARETLEASARRLLGRSFQIVGQRAGVRVNLPDRHPVAGRHPENSRLGAINGLGAKGVLLAPMLARQWADHLTQGTAFDREIDLARFYPRGANGHVSAKNES